MTLQRDTTSGWVCPETAAEWTTLLSGSGLDAPSSTWLCQDASGDVLDVIGSADLTPSGGLSYQQTATGWTRKGVKLGFETTDYLRTTAGPNMVTDSVLLLQMFALGTSPSTYGTLCRFGETVPNSIFWLTGDGLRNHVQVFDNEDSAGTYSGVFVVATLYNASTATQTVYTQTETLANTPASQSAPDATNLYMLGDGGSSTDSTLVYAAMWTGADAEVDETTIRRLFARLRTGTGASTLLTMQTAGSLSSKWIALIEGCKYVVTDCNDTDAVHAALHGTDWENATVIPWLRVEMRNEQSITPLDSFVPNMSRCLLRVGDDDRQDTFGTFINRRMSGAETVLTATLDRVSSVINVKSTSGFPSSGEAFIGTECVGYDAIDATSLGGTVIRGKYSPFSSGTGTRFPNHHRVSKDTSHVMVEPVVSQYPRTWMGKRVGVWLHSWDGTSLNARSDAQLVFAGRLVSIADDPNTFETILEIEPVLEEVRNAVIGKDMWSATIAPGIDIKEGRVFKFEDWKYTYAVKEADDLVVVSGAPASTNEMQAGIYELEELCGVLSAWLGAEKASGRIYGHYVWHSPVSSNVGLRTKCYWKIEDGGGSLPCSFGIDMPGEVFAFLGLGADEPGTTGQSERWAKSKKTNSNNIAQGESVPFTSLVFKPYASGRIAQEFNEAISYKAQDERGTFVNQRTLMPASVKGSTTDDKDWGFFLLDDKALMVGSYASNTLTNCWLAPFQLTADKDASGLSYIGRRADEPEGSPVSMRQILILEASFAILWNTLFYSTGTDEFNHAEYDKLGYGLGLGIPGRLTGPDMERTVTLLPGADAPLVVVIDEPTKLEDMLGADLKVRRSFVRWRDQGLELCQWKTPTLAESSYDLSDSNKAEPSSVQANHRAPTMEAQFTQRPIVKLDYSRDFAVGRDGQYLKSIQFEDQVAVDDLGGNLKPETLKMRNTFSQFAHTGAAIEALAPGFMAFMPCVSRPWRALARSIDIRAFEGLTVGDVVSIDDLFARDPVTGQRGFSNRPAVITRHWYDLGGSSSGGEVRSMAGGVEVMFLDAHRGEAYAPGAAVDDTVSTGGFSAGYNNGTKTLRTKAHEFSHDTTYETRRGTVAHIDDNDADGFEAGDKILIIEDNPDDVTAPLYWERTVASQSGVDLVMTATLSAPAWDATKKYLVIPQKYSQVQTSQQDFAHQADADLNEVEGDPTYHWGAGTESLTYDKDEASRYKNVATMTAGDGRPQDVAIDRIQAHNANALIDFKTAHQGPFLWSIPAQAGFAGAVPAGGWKTIFIAPVFVGLEHPTVTIRRYLTIAPMWRSASLGILSWLRVTIARIKPQVAPADTDSSDGFGTPYTDAVFTGEFSQSTTWSTSSNTWTIESDVDLNLSVADLNYGFVWLVIEGAGDAECAGLTKCIESARVVPHATEVFDGSIT